MRKYVLINGLQSRVLVYRVQPCQLPWYSTWAIQASQSWTQIWQFTYCFFQSIDMNLWLSCQWFWCHGFNSRKVLNFSAALVHFALRGSLTHALLYCCTLYIFSLGFCQYWCCSDRDITWTSDFHCFWALWVWPWAGLSHMNAAKMQWNWVNSVVKPWKTYCPQFFQISVAQVKHFVSVWSLMYA